MNSCELVTYISSIACAIARCCPKEDLAVLATAFTQLGDTLETILAHNERCSREPEVQTPASCSVKEAKAE